MPAIGKILIISGVVLIIVGIGFMVSDKIPFIGRLPGDIMIKKSDLVSIFPSQLA